MPSTIRTGVASGVGALSWIAFLPFALLFGLVSDDRGANSAGWILTARTVLAGLLLARVALAAMRPRGTSSLGDKQTFIKLLRRR